MLQNCGITLHRCQMKRLISLGERVRSLSSYQFIASVNSRPNTAKSLNGEDASLITPCGRAIGVADGVHFSNKNIDSGKYSRENCQKIIQEITEAEAETDCTLATRQIMQTGFEQVKNLGSSTACLLALNGTTLESTNIGDSGYVILRRKPEESYRKKKDSAMWNLLFKFTPMQHYFNHPVQLGTGSSSSPELSSDNFKMPVNIGDLVILASDGLYDNVFYQDIFSIVEDHQHDEDPDLISYCETVHDSLQNERILSRWTNLLAEKLAEAAYLKSRSKGIPSPFQVQAEKAGHLFQGGKKDDITVLVALVTA